MLRLGERTADQETLLKAVDCFENALLVFREGEAGYYIEVIDNNLKLVQQALADLRGKQP